MAARNVEERTSRRTGNKRESAWTIGYTKEEKRYDDFLKGNDLIIRWIKNGSV